MSDKKAAKPVALAVGAALAGAFAFGATANAETGASPFAMTTLSAGYMLGLGEGSCGGDKGDKAEGEGSCGEGSCGGDKEKDGEASCGGAKDGAEGDGKEKSEGSCGEGSCGGDTDKEGE
jgi:uncharacterized low-complexity protein